MGAVPQSILEACFGCGKIGNWSSKCPRCKLNVKIGSAYVARQPRALKVCFDYRENDHFSRECSQYQFIS